MSADLDPYAALGVARTASQDEINSAYRRLVRQHHPDSRADASPDDGSAATLERVLAAYAILRDPQRRAEYDRGHAPQPPAAGPRSGPQAAPRTGPQNRRTSMTIRVSPVRHHGPGS